MLGLMLACTGLTSCNAQNSTQALIKEIRAVLPQPLGLMGDMTDVNVVDGNVEFTIRCNEDFMDLKSLQQEPDQMKLSLKQSMLAQKNDPNVKLVIDELTKIGKGLTYKFIGAKSGTTIKVKLSADDLKEIKNSHTSLDDVESLLQMNVQNTNTQCPMDVGNGLVWTNTAIENNYVVYHYEADEDFISIDLLKANEDLVHQSLLDEAKAMKDDPTFKIFIKLCKQTDKGLAYRYIGNKTGNTAIILITADELKNL